MSHETWWQVHLLTYLALALSFSHQIATGASFVHHPLARLAWTLLWLSTAGVVLTCRVRSTGVADGVPQPPGGERCAGVRTTSSRWW